VGDLAVVFVGTGVGNLVGFSVGTGVGDAVTIWPDVVGLWNWIWRFREAEDIDLVGEKVGATLGEELGDEPGNIWASHSIWCWIWGGYKCRFWSRCLVGLAVIGSIVGGDLEGTIEGDTNGDIVGLAVVGLIVVGAKVVGFRDRSQC
jgi:hypothetical protein